MGLNRIISLPVEFLLYKLEEVIFRYVLELLCSIGACVAYEPLKDFLESVLTSLLIGNIVAKSGLLVELCERIGCLFEAYLEAIQMHISPTHARSDMLGGLTYRLECRWGLSKLLPQLCSHFPRLLIKSILSETTHAKVWLLAIVVLESEWWRLLLISVWLVFHYEGRLCEWGVRVEVVRL